jgi:hypothetical protein
VKGIVDAALPLLVGGAAGVGVGATAGAGLQAVVAGIVAALGAVAVVKLSTKRTTTQSRVENFIFDLSLATLDRILPVCIERLWRAGLAPMFVVDELDKVDDLPKRMRDVVHHLKKLVAESAFFCFLADRQYFEDMLDQTSNRAYPQEYTYYSHRLFVAFQAGDFADYLEQKLQIVPAPADTASASTGAASDAPVPVATPPVAGAAGANAAPGRPDATGSSPETIAGAPAEQALAQAQAQAQARIQAQLAQGQREEDDKVVRDILIWAVRHRAQLHPLDLRRALRALADEDNRVTVSAGDVLRTAYRIDVTIQVLIEALLASTDVVQKIANEFESLRLIHDALYFITREWLQGKAELEINERGKRVFADYLEVRTGRTATGGDGQGHDEAHAQRTAAKKTAKKTRKKRGARQTPESDAAAARPAAIGLNGASLNTYDADFLFRLVRDLATALADKGAADKLIDDWQNPADAARRPKKPLADNVRSRLLLDPTQSVLVAKVRSKDGTDVIYEWRYDPSGRPRIPSVPAEVAAAPGTVESTAQTATPLDTPLGAETPTPGALPAWVQCWSDIQAFAARLNAAILAPEQLQQPLLGYRALARQFGLIPATPPWEEVEEAHRRLERGGQSADAVAEDTKRLLDFRNKVRSRESVIARALACAAAIGVASGANEPSERVVRGLTVLARSLRLTQRSEDDVAVSLAAVASDLQSLFPALRDDGQAPLPPASSEALAETLPTFIVAVQNALLVNEESWEPLLALAWNGALSRQISLYSGRGLSDPGVPELLHACRETGPSAILNVDPRQMTAAQWTTALVAAVKSPQTSKDIAVGEVPAWVGLTAMRELGLRSTSTGLQRAMKVLTRGGRLEAHSPLVDLFGPTITAASSAEAAVIVVRRPASTLTTSWLPPVPRYVALVATPAQIDALIAHEFPLGQLIRAPRQLVAVEVDEDPDEAIPDLDLSQGEPPVLHKISEAWKHLSSRPVFIYAHDPKSRPPGPFVVAPARFENLVTADYRQAR